MALGYTQITKFQHTAARRRLGGSNLKRPDITKVSTHSRPKAAGFKPYIAQHCIHQFQHTAARRRLALTNYLPICRRKFQHTAARRRLGRCFATSGYCFQFQHTAARRRLVHEYKRLPYSEAVSTHSRPKAAGTYLFVLINWGRFQHTAARRRLGNGKI